MQSSSVAELPPHILALLLRYVPLADRITNCSLVSTQFRAAAAAATLCISTDLRADELGSFSFRAWLQRYGAHVTSLQLASTAVTDLPCQQLKQLKLSHCAVQLGADSGQIALTCSSTQLTSLELEICVVAGGAQLPAVATLTNLQRLDLHLYLRGEPPFHGIASDSLLQELSQCSKLTHLGLSGAGIITSDASLQHLSAVTGLEALKLHWLGQSSISAAGLSTLQYLQQLKSLDLETVYQGMDFVGIRTGSAPAFSYLTALRDLRLDGIYVEASVLLDATQLCVLRLIDVSILADSDLLAVLSRLTCLQELVLEDVCLHDGWPADVAAYSSLVSSSNLQCLKLKDLGGPLDDSEGIPAAALARILGQNLRHRLPFLRALELPTCAADLLQISHTGSPGLPQLTYLQQLCLNRCTIESDVLSSLTQLTGLQLDCARLQLAADYDDVLLPTLAMMQQLQQLEIRNLPGSAPLCCRVGQPSEFGDPEVVELTAWPVRNVSDFTALLSSSHLTHLVVYGCQLPAGAWQQALTAQQWQLPWSALVTCYLQTPRVPRAGPAGNHPQLQEGYEPSALLHQAGVAALVCRCPSLQACSIGLQSGAQLSALRDLKRLTALTVRYQLPAAAEAGSDMLGGLHTVTGLKWLRICSIEGSINDHMLSPARLLTALRRLTRMGFVDSDVNFDFNFPLLVRHHVQTVSDTRVWSALP